VLLILSDSLLSKSIDHLNGFWSAESFTSNLLKSRVESGYITDDFLNLTNSSMNHMDVSIINNSEYSKCKPHSTNIVVYPSGSQTFSVTPHFGGRKMFVPHRLNKIVTKWSMLNFYLKYQLCVAPPSVLFQIIE